MSTGTTSFHSFFNSYISGCKKTLIVSSDGEFGLGIIIVKQMKNHYVTRYGDKLYNTIITSHIEYLEDWKLWGFSLSKEKPILMF